MRTDFTAAELNLFRQWFNAVEDGSSEYLYAIDYMLYNKIQKILGNRIRKVHLDEIKRLTRIGKFDIQ